MSGAGGIAGTRSRSSSVPRRVTSPVVPRGPFPGGTMDEPGPLLFYFTFLPIASLFLEASHQQGAHTACPRPPHPHRNQNKALSFLSNENTVTRDLVPREGGRQHKQKLWSCDSSVPIKHAATAGSHTRQQNPSALGVRPASTRVTR